MPGINFMIAAFGMVAAMRGRRVESCRSIAGVLLTCLVTSFSAAVIVNAVMTAAQVHRVEGIACYFGGLVLLHELVQRFDRATERESASTLEAAPLLWYYAIAVAVPLANGAATNGAAFVEHAVFVLVVLLVVVALAAGGRELVRVIWRAA